MGCSRGPGRVRAKKSGNLPRRKSQQSIRNPAGEYPNRRATSAEASLSTKKARKASYWRCRGVAGSAKKRRQSVRSNGTPIDMFYNVKYQIWCQSAFSSKTQTTTRNPHMTAVSMHNRNFVDNVSFRITNNETSRNCYISVLFRLIPGAKLSSQKNPLAGSMSGDSPSVEIQARK